MRTSRTIALVLLALCLLATTGTGCGRRRSGLLMERRARGQIAQERHYGIRQVVQTYPTEHQQSKQGVEVTARFTSMADLRTYFHNEEIFGQDAGANPYQPENIVFYIQIANRGSKRITIDPDQFFLVDDMGVQYAYLSIDYLNALAERKMGVGDLTRMGLSRAPDVYGVDVGGFTAGLLPKSRQRFAALKQVSLSRGPIFPGVVYDGFISFFRPHKDARKVRLILSSFKSDFDANDEPKQRLDFTFEFELMQAVIKEPRPEEIPDDDALEAEPPQQPAPRDLAVTDLAKEVDAGPRYVLEVAPNQRPPLLLKE